MKLHHYIAAHRPTLEKRLVMYLSTKQKEFSERPLYVQSIQKLIDTVTSGKLIRGIIILLAYESKKHTISEDALTLAAAIELFHTGLLIHDDIMDNDHLRRGKPTIFAQGIEEGQNLDAKNPREYGNAIAICIGDLAFFMAYELLGTLQESLESRQILLTSATELQKVGFAQITDVHFGIDSFEPTEEEIVSLYTLKTARYSFSLPLRLGGMLAGCDTETLQRFDTFGEELGIAYQIKDDELGIFGNEATLGKPVGSDIRENKKTLFRKSLFSVVNEKTKKELSALFGSKLITESDIAVIKEYLTQYEILSSIRKVRERKSDNARQILDTIIMPEQYKQIFTDLVEFTNNRSS